jgi:hypothetical protein
MISNGFVVTAPDMVGGQARRVRGESTGDERTEECMSGTGAEAAHSDPCVEIAGQRPNEVGIGGALITLVEPDPGFEHAYNRWYEDDHFYAGAMCGPWTFAGKRWVATRDLQELRYPADDPLVKPLRAGCYLTAHLLTEGHSSEAARWYRAVMSDNLYLQGRGFDQRRHVFTAQHGFLFSVLRDSGPLAPQHALDYPFCGTVLEVLRATGSGGRTGLVDWLRATMVPSELKGSPCPLVLAFHPEGEKAGTVPGLDAVPTADQLVTVLWLLEADPRTCWSRWQSHGPRLDASGLGRVVFAAPFVSTVPGTDLYVSELR